MFSVAAATGKSLRGRDRSSDIDDVVVVFNRPERSPNNGSGNNNNNGGNDVRNSNVRNSASGSASVS